MKFTEKDKEVYGRISETLRKREATGALEEGDVSRSDLNYLLNNSNPDLAILGTHAGIFFPFYRHNQPQRPLMAIMHLEITLDFS